MFRLNKIGMIKLSLKKFIKYYLFISLIMPVNISLSQTIPTDKKQLATNSKMFNLKVSNLETPSLGSIGVKTKINDSMLLDVWQEMSAAEIVKQLNYIPDIVLQLRPTQPCRKVSTIDECLDIFISNMDNYDSLRTVIPFEKSPFKMYTILNNNLKPLFNKVNEIDEPFNQCRQVLPQSYLHNGYIDIFKASIVNYGTISGNNIYPYVMDINDTIDIDYMDDWDNAENK